jgi:1,4-dihydroxy-2-naphthoate octaprenyltransferase
VTHFAPYYLTFYAAVLIDVLLIILALVAIVAAVAYTLADIRRHRPNGRG